MKTRRRLTPFGLIALLPLVLQAASNPSLPMPLPTAAPPAAAPPTAASPALPAATPASVPAAAPATPAPTAELTTAPVPPPASAKAKTKAGATAPKAVAAPSPLTPRFQMVRDRIDALLHDRLETPPPPDPRFNPFRAAGAAPPVPVAVVPGSKDAVVVQPAPVNNDGALLQQAVAMLNIKGTLLKDGRYQRMINSSFYKAGDVISVTVQGQPVHVRVRQITQYTLMLSLNDAEVTLRF